MMNPIAFEIFGIAIYWYGLVIATGILIAFAVAAFIMKKLNYKDDIPYEILLVIVPIGILGARIYFIIFNGSPLSDFFNFRDGGIAIYGAIIGGALGLWIYTRFVRRCSFFAVSDVLVICLVLAQSIGRWGNFFNQELYGYEVGFHFFPLTVMIYGKAHLALFFYESILNLAGFFLLLKIFTKQQKWGTTSAFYFIFYGIIRAILEPLRLPVYQLMFLGVPVSVLVSFAVIGLGVLIIYLNNKNKIPQNNVMLLKEGGTGGNV